MSEDLLLFGRAAAPGGGIPWSYKILGSRDPSGYQLALEATDYARAHVAKFSLEQLLDALEEKEGVRPQPEDMLLWLREAFDGRKVQALVADAEVVLLAPFQRKLEDEVVLFNIRLPPPTAKGMPISGDGVRWVAADIAASLLSVRSALSKQLANCEEQATTTQQMIALSDFLSNKGVGGIGGLASPTKGGLEDAGQPAGLGGAVGSAVKPASCAPTTAAAAAPAAVAAGISGHTAQTSQQSHQVSDTGIVTRPGRGRGRGRGRAMVGGATKIAKTEQHK